MKYNPFRPGEIIVPGMFAGRLYELEQIEKALFQTSQGNPKNILITGERGIGKSSLLLVTKYLAEGHLKTFDEREFKFLVSAVLVSEKDSLERIIVNLVNDLMQRSRSDAFLAIVKEYWDRIAEVGVGWIRVRKAEKPSVDEVVQSFVYFLERVLDTSRDDAQGLLLLIDEVDKASTLRGFSSFVKTTLEKLRYDGHHNVMFALAGLTDVRDKLHQGHQSVLRFFDIHELGPLDQKDRRKVIEKGLQDATDKTGTAIEVEDDALTTICDMSEGYPHFLQELGYSSVEVDTDNHISLSDVIDAITGNSTYEGAVKRLGKQYFERMYYQAIKSDEYREILNIMAEENSEWVHKKKIAEKFSGRPTTLDNALHALKDRNIIQGDKSRRGFYKLPWRAFRTYIRLYTKARISPAMQSNEAPSGASPDFEE